MTARTTKGSKPLHGSPIEAYCMIGDCETAALISRDGSVDWLCWPDFSSEACFAALLGTKDHGYWKIAPSAPVKAISRHYVEDTLVVETTFKTRGGEVRVIDFMPPRQKNSHLIRIVRGVRGRVKMRMDFVVRFDYGRTVPWVTQEEAGLRAIAGPQMVVLSTKVPLRGKGLTTVGEFTVGEGEEVSFTLTRASSLQPIPKAPDPAKALVQTIRFWTTWSKRNTYRGKYAKAVSRSLLTLKALTYKPSGGIVAAVTAGLPEKIGGTRNWDYRFCWLRDTSFTLLTLLALGYYEEAMSWRQWLLRAVAGASGQMQALYGIRGERQVLEWTADWLPGYENSKPVRFGNGAVGQFQLDIFGEVIGALARTPDARDETRISALALQKSLVNHLCEVWPQPDDGIWETRGPRKHFTYSKVMAWAALNQAIRNHEKFGGAGDVELWKKNRELIHKEVCARGFNKKLNSFVQSYGSQQLDASCLRIVLVGFLPPEDPRIRGTVEAIEKRLVKQGLVARYDTKTAGDGLPRGEGAFLACSFWLVINLWLVGRKRDATALFERLLALSNDVGLLSEEYDQGRKRLVGNFPQALSHISLVHAALTLAGGWKPPDLSDH